MVGVWQGFEKSLGLESDITVIIIQSLFQFWVWAVTVTYVLYGFGRGLVGVW